MSTLVSRKSLKLSQYEKEKIADYRRKILEAQMVFAQNENNCDKLSTLRSRYDSMVRVIKG